jgi:hypothetical protein
MLTKPLVSVLACSVFLGCSSLALAAGVSIVRVANSTPFTFQLSNQTIKRSENGHTPSVTYLNQVILASEARLTVVKLYNPNLKDAKYELKNCGDIAKIRSAEKNKANTYSLLISGGNTENYQGHKDDSRITFNCHLSPITIKKS